MARRYEVVPLRLEPATVQRLDTLATRLGVPRTVLMRQMVERATDMVYSLAGEDPEET